MTCSVLQLLPPVCIEYGVMMRFFKVPARTNQAGEQPASSYVRHRVGRTFAVLGLCAFVVAGCASGSGSGSGSNSSRSLGPGGGDGINDAALGVAASPRVTDQARDLPRGGGRAQVGRPYRIAGRLYTPREDPDYDQTGVASWYGDAFHGRLTANGEVYDMHTLSAAHPTLPLPSYVRVTNTTNNRSVVVRVNDRGPFSRNRIIDLSKRAADVLDFRSDGIARVRVQFMEQARLDGEDVAWLEASAQINGVPMNGADAGTMFAQGPTPPVPTAAPAQVAAFVATNDRAPQTAPRVGEPVPAVLASPAPTLQAPDTPRPALEGVTPVRAQSGPLDLTPSATLGAATPVTLPAAAPTPSFAPAQPGLVPNAPIPNAAVGFTAAPVSPQQLQTGFEPRNRSDLALTGRIEIAHRRAAASALDAAGQLALQSQTLSHIAPLTAADPVMTASITPHAATQMATVQIGIFGDPQNVARLQTALQRFGTVLSEPVQSGSRTLTQVRLQAPVSSPDAARALLRQLASEGYTDAYLTDPSDA